jgi:hypothetical protein
VVNQVNGESTATEGMNPSAWSGPVSEWLGPKPTPIPLPTLGTIDISRPVDPDQIKYGGHSTEDIHRDPTTSMVDHRKLGR